MPYRGYGGRSGGGGYRGGPYSSTGVYTSSGRPVSNVAAYEAAGGKCFTSSGGTIRNASSYSNAVMSYRSQGSSNPHHYYHYTTSEGAAAIQSSGRINPSTGPGDCALGEGTYVTSKAPNCSKVNVLSNNYGQTGPGDNRADAYVKIPAERVEAMSGKSVLGRDVYVIQGAVDLKETGAVVRTK
ncbi:unnamed protein product [Symbiodinium sp. CCMP2592]|nr:unnamed protein product [Symbiodinium sp. CCMP2592]